MQHELERAPLAVLASTDADYERYGLTTERVEPFEDGARTDGRAGTYEWWYFDAHLEDGAKLVIVFMNKDFRVSTEAVDAARPAEPRSRRRTQR
jgi:predicted secreted hydrolase